VDYQVEYDVNFQQFRRNSVYLQVSEPRFSLSGGWSRSVRLSENVDERTVGAQTLRGQTTIELVPKRFFLEGSADYDWKNDILYQARAQARYAVQCCGFSLEYIRYNYNGRDEKQWRFNLNLANIGSMGNFLGAGQTSAGGAYR